MAAAWFPGLADELLGSSHWNPALNRDAPLAIIPCNEKSWNDQVDIPPVWEDIEKTCAVVCSVWAKVRVEDA